MNKREELLAEIETEESRLASLREDAREVTGRIRELRERLARSERAAAGKTPALPFTRKQDAPASQDEKLTLFRSLFRGRDDVFPRLWESSKSGKKGYSPACDNEWVRGLCLKPQVKCGECPNQAFTQISDEVTRAHLVGKHVMGVYPLLEDETCLFLAADFDKKSWMEDVVAYVETCRSFGVEPAVERSRSGNGAHVWFFFESPVSAASARRMGCFFLTETMSGRHQLGLDSYDRFFPDQDTLPAGGFGNLIALPLQREAREKGNSLFVDGAFEPYSDQWQFLSSVVPVSRPMVESLSDEASRRGQVIGVRVAPTDEHARTPWNRLPSGRARFVPVSTPLPNPVKGVLSQRLFIEKDGLPSPVLNQLKRGVFCRVRPLLISFSFFVSWPRANIGSYPGGERATSGVTARCGTGGTAVRSGESPLSPRWSRQVQWTWRILLGYSSRVPESPGGLSNGSSFRGSSPTSHPQTLARPICEVLCVHDSYATLAGSVQLWE